MSVSRFVLDTSKV
ncbi:hypothetical protein LINPERPRIM_LOCUS33173 [Linum perenne]